MILKMLMLLAIIIGMFKRDSQQGGAGADKYEA